MRKLYLKNKILIRLARPFENRRLFTPLQLTIYTLKDYGLWPEKLVALDAFCQTGLQWTRIFYQEAAYIEMWDIDPKALKYARKEFPRAIVCCGDSILALKNKMLGRSDFNFVMLDIPIPFRYGDGKFEHFDFFEDVFQNTAYKCIVVFDVVPDIRKIIARHPQSGSFIEEWQHARRKFYQTPDGEYVAPGTMIARYSAIVEQKGYHIDLVNYNARNVFFGFITLAISK
jgi:SAM-dependent methyltransferase